MQQEESDLITDILGGNTSKYAYLVDLYSKMCFSVAYGVVKNSEEAEDIVQETFISAYENLKSFKGNSKFSTWIYKIALNKALASKNKKKYFDDVESISIESDDYDEELEKKTENELKLAFSILNEKEKLVIDLFYFNEQSIKEIAQIFETSESNIKVLLHRTRKKMLEKLSNNRNFTSNE